MHPSTPEKPSTTRPMRRADREVRSFEEIIDILRPERRLQGVERREQRRFVLGKQRFGTHVFEG